MKKIINTPQAAPAIGPYSQAVVCGGLMFVSGMIPLTPAGNLVEGDLKSQTKQVLDNLKSVVETGGRTLNDVVKTTIYLTDLSLFAEVNMIYGEYFSEDPPARATIGVAALPKGVGIEIEAVVAMQ